MLAKQKPHHMATKNTYRLYMARSYHLVEYHMIRYSIDLGCYCNYYTDHTYFIKIRPFNFKYNSTVGSCSSWVRVCVCMCVCVCVTVTMKISCLFYKTYSGVTLPKIFFAWLIFVQRAFGMESFLKKLCTQILFTLTSYCRHLKGAARQLHLYLFTRNFLKRFG